MSPTNQITYRDYKPTDLPALVQLDEACFEPPFRFSTPTMRRFVEADNAWVIIAEENGSLAGFCILHHERVDGMHTGYVITIDVAKPYRRKGIGERMLSDGEIWVRSFNGAGIMLHAFVLNTPAVRFYEKLGYTRLGIQRGFYGGTLDAALYWKELTRA